ncbi:MAG TPA: KaiC associated regulatory domain-containing protein [Thermoplasmatales archaeon]|nr:KaiC associated regulatory domain-containing protein [Thermoplasmatales archaeon]HEX17288.1 KaiC associated regulatory domain-containing protein [Thermoplasmatales archaeon]
MEVIDKAVRNIDIDAMAEQVFQESINILGGLRKLIEYRNLTWLPSLAEAAYAVVMKEELMKTHKEIAFDLGLAPQTVQNILRADAKEVERFIKGEIEKVDEHKAGGIAKLAYERVKREKRITLKEGELEVLGVDWAIRVLMRLRGMDFPIKKEQLCDRIGEIVIKGKPFKTIVDEMKPLLSSPAEVLKEIKRIVG